MITSENILDLITPDGGAFKVGSLPEAYDFCLGLARTHYENFPVASFFLPKEKIPIIASIYAFARIADDIADELTDISADERFALIERYRGLLEICDVEALGNPVFYALGSSIKGNDLPKEAFHRLLTAFQMDIKFRQPENFEELLYYCQHSANPVGELVLRVFDNYSEETGKLSDNICTGLQLINFWQDLSVDLGKGRIYLPKDLLQKYNFDVENLHNGENSIKLSELLDEVLGYTADIFSRGKELVYLLKEKRLRYEIALTYNGGELMLKKLRRMNADLLRKRPELSKFEIIQLAMKSIKAILR